MRTFRFPTVPECGYFFGRPKRINHPRHSWLYTKLPRRLKSNRKN